MTALKESRQHTSERGLSWFFEPFLDRCSPSIASLALVEPLESSSTQGVLQVQGCQRSLNTTQGGAHQASVSTTRSRLQLKGELTPNKYKMALAVSRLRVT